MAGISPDVWSVNFVTLYHVYRCKLQQWTDLFPHWALIIIYWSLWDLGTLGNLKVLQSKFCLNLFAGYVTNTER